MPRKPNRWSALVACAGGACLVLLAAASPASAADTDRADAIRQRYLADRAACLSGQTGEDLKNCLREAGAAAQAARQGKLLEGPDEHYRQNALARCAPLPAEQREACRMRIEGAGKVVGSVEGGGLYRELIIREPASASSSASTPATPAASPAAAPPGAAAAPSAGAPATTVVSPLPGTPAVVAPGAAAAASPPVPASPAAPAAAAAGGPTFTPVQPVVPGRGAAATPSAATPSAANPPAAGSLQISPPSTPVMQAPPSTVAPQPALVEPGNVPPRGAQ